MSPSLWRELRPIVQAHDRRFIQDPGNEAYGLAVGYKETNGQITDEFAVTFLVPPGAKERFRRRHRMLRTPTPPGSFPQRLGDGRIELRTDVVEEELPEAYTTVAEAEGYTAALSQRWRPFGVGCEIAPFRSGVYGTAGNVFRIPGQRDVLGTCRHVVETLSAVSPENALSKPIAQPRSSDANDIIGTVWRVAPLHIYTSIDTPITQPDQADFALISLNPGGPPPSGPLGVGMDALIDQAYAALEDDVWDTWDEMLPRGVAWCGYPHRHGNFWAQVAVPIGVSTLTWKPYPRGLGTVSIGDPVWKVGRTTMYTEGTCIRDYGSTWVKYREGAYAFMTDCQWFAPAPGYERMAAPGDSGSATYDNPNLPIYHCVSSLCAGSAGRAIGNRIQHCVKGVLTPEEWAHLDLNAEV